MQFTELEPLTESNYTDDQRISSSDGNEPVFEDNTARRTDSDRILMASYFRQVPEFEYVSRLLLMVKILVTTPVVKNLYSRE